MNVHFSYKLPKTPDLEKTIEQQIEKLRKRLQVFHPELISLYGTVEEGSKTGTTVSLNLRLPSGQMAAQMAAERSEAAIKSAFDNLIEQLGKHKQHLRSEYKWPRVRRVERTRAIPQVPFEATLAAVKAEKISAADVSRYVNLNLPRLQRFVERELRFRESSARLRDGQISPEEVIDETISHALGDHHDRPERISLEPWLYRLAMRSIDRLTNQTRTENGSVALESQLRPGPTGGTASDEPMMQFHQPDEMFTNETTIADMRIATPEDVAAQDELVAMVEAALRNTKHEDREAFILFTMEGFTTHEIAAITSRKPEEVRASIAAARDHLRKKFPSTKKLKKGAAERIRTSA